MLDEIVDGFSGMCLSALTLPVFICSLALGGHLPVHTYTAVKSVRYGGDGSKNCLAPAVPQHAGEDERSWRERAASLLLQSATAA